MKKETVFLVLTCFTWLCSGFDLGSQFVLLRPRTDSETQKKAAEGVLKRLLKGHSGVFEITISSSLTSLKDGFQVYKEEKEKGLVYVTAPNAVSALWGVGYYLRYYCNCYISWDGDQWDGFWYNGFPAVNISFTSPDTFRFYQNPCASSYSYVWWDWDRWEREIDWMALNGINIALAFTAQEAIWQRVFDGFGLSSNDFTGPAFLAWYRMGNIRNFAQGFPNGWHRYRIKLQHKILNRMRELGITPVLPGFCGIIPRSLQMVFPVLQVTKVPKWNKFSEENCCPYFLNPSDPLFIIISQVYFREYVKEFGTNNIYSCDMFNENKPPIKHKDYILSVSQGIIRSMMLADPLAVWMLQSWMFKDPYWENKKLVESFLRGVPIGKLLILDLQADLEPQYVRLNNFFGHAFIWCNLHNFGGQLGMYGHLNKINEGIKKVRRMKTASMVGIGITPEGIDQNYIVYEFTLDNPLMSQPINLTDWVSKYSLRRYGIYGEFEDEARQLLEEAWLILKDTAYNFHPSSVKLETVKGIKNISELNGEHMSKNILTKLPTLKLNELTWYNKSRIFDVYRIFYNASRYHKVRSKEIFRHDFIDVTRQTIQFAVSTLYFNIINSYTLSDQDSFQNNATMLLEILDELDKILATGRKYLFGKWLLDAFYWGAGPSQKNCSYEARNLVTLWGPNGELRDYAAKQWAGLVIDYYKPRWSIFLKALNDSLLGRARYNAAAVKEKIFLTVEKPFVESNKNYDDTPIGDTAAIIGEFNHKWEPILFEIFKNRTMNKLELNTTTTEENSD